MRWTGSAGEHIDINACLSAKLTEQVGLIAHFMLDYFDSWVIKLMYLNICWSHMFESQAYWSSKYTSVKEFIC